jgi:hypothetical protein
MGVDDSSFPLSTRSSCIDTNARPDEIFKELFQAIAQQVVEDPFKFSEKNSPVNATSNSTPVIPVIQKTILEEIQQSSKVNLPPELIQQPSTSIKNQTGDVFKTTNNTPEINFLDKIRNAAYEASPVATSSNKDTALLFSEAALQAGGMGAPQNNQEDLSLKEGGPTFSSYSESSETTDPTNAPNAMGLPTLAFGRFIENYSVQMSAKNRKTEKAGSDKK